MAALLARLSGCCYTSGMGIFGKKQRADAAGFVGTGVAATAVQVDTLTLVKVNGQRIVLARWENELFAFSDDCPHAAASLSDGSLNRWKVSCPDHGYCFDIRNGRITWPEDELYRLKRYELKIEGGEVRVKVGR